MSYASEAGNFSVALSGDCMLTRGLAMFDEPAFLALAQIFRDCDAGFGNLETVVRRADEGLPGITRGTYMQTAPELLADLKWFGVNMVGTANNHSFDYGEGGLLATLRHLDAAGIVHAGSGRNLAEARMPGYLDTRGGRVALLATTATYRPWNAAGPQRGDSPGRPGINPLAFKNSYAVDSEAFGALQRISRQLGFERTRERDRTHFYSDAEAPLQQADSLDLLGAHYIRGDGFKISSTGDSDDVADNLRWIREARRMADWVVVSFHTHEFGHASLATAKTKIDLHEPADFAVAFARAAIDAGADIFVGHGSHTPLGIEIYKGKPIFYSVGNLFLENETLPSFPAQAYKRFGLAEAATPADFLDARTGNGSKGHVAQEGFWENIAVTCHFSGGSLGEIRIHPIDQGFQRPRSQRGRPVLAAEPIAGRVIARVEQLSRPFGTIVETRGGTGVINLRR
ncbi:MAG TPA: CapA family protein [Beijerinckiaceae bacterium]|jgi:poly-gamma-glutamate synthesis protein (capsule biosynthesis protein)|nr:CapA family protein [Beijerinckiaceae bacterium]